MAQVINPYNSNWILGGKGNMKAPRPKGVNLAGRSNCLDSGPVMDFNDTKSPNMQEAAQIRSTQTGGKYLSIISTHHPMFPTKYKSNRPPLMYSTICRVVI
jgi:hypothetical protein